MMSRIYEAICAVCILASACGSADVRAEGWSLDRCVDYALEHNIDVRRQMLEVRQGELAVREAKDRVLPNLSGYGSENFNFGRGLSADNTYVNRNTSSFSVGAQLSLPLFQGLRVVRNCLLYTSDAADD